MFFLKLISRLPFSILYLISDFLFLMIYHVFRYRRSVVWSNLKNSFPEKSGNEINQIEKQFYQNLCDYAVETIKLLTLNPNELKRRMVFVNTEVIQSCKDKGQSMLLMASHQFNWEWLISAANLWLPVTVDFIYQPQSSDLANQFSLQTRSRFGSLAIKRSEVIRQLISRKHILRAVANVADQFPGHGNDKRYWTMFLHQETAFFEGVNNLAIMMQYPVFFAKIIRVKRGYYEMEFVKIGEPPYPKGSVDVIENYVKETEKVIRYQPEGWLWSHKRWKKKKAEID